ncbi:metallo-beta-lactamase domain-containing protein 1-like [Magallana gigas]|uniref:metallo-beta-lactamase domain-containing protein 1-like n=1 Tax=Magallana gigas TaxID=29159 RepID=UPI00333EF4C6
MWREVETSQASCLGVPYSSHILGSSMESLNNSPDYHMLRASCLDTLAKYILGIGTVQDLVNYVNDKVRLPCRYPIIPRTQHQMGLLTRTKWWARVEAYKMLPVNSPAVLIHWRILLALVGTMTPKNRSDFKSLGREKLLQLEDQVRVHQVPIPVVIEDEWTVIDECGGEDDNYEVVIIQEGYSVPHQDKIKMGSSITLIKGPLNIIVDTGNPTYRDHIIEALETNNVSVHDIECCITTHGHIDHIGNLDLFPIAYYITHVHNFQSEGSFAVNDDVEVIPTPGHTSEDISVIVKNTQLGTIAVVGDLFHSEEDMEDSFLWRSRSQDPARQEANRHKILRLVDYVVPGHGKMFQTPRK